MQQLNTDIAITSTSDSPLSLFDIQLLLRCDSEAAKVKDMLNAAKKDYVMKNHPRKIFRMKPSKSWKDGCFKTYVYVNDKRKEMIAGTEERLIEKLYVFYRDQNGRTLKNVFDALMEYKVDCLKRSENTIVEDRNNFKRVSDKLKEAMIDEITDEDIRKWIVSDYLKTDPKPHRFRKLLQLLNQIFEYAVRKKMCADNPMRYITARDYLHFCDNSQKTDEEKAFSEDELERITADAIADASNPRAVMALLAKETGMRAGELAVLHKSDIKDKYIHVHRQQLRVKEPNKKIYFQEVLYTKDERVHPHNGRFIPLTTEAKEVLELASRIPGESEYVFHDPDSSEMVNKDSYIHNLRKRCLKLGCTATNNHAFRMAFNSRLIEMGFSPSDRALILGHQVQTNEAHYSLTDKRRLDDIIARMN